MAGEIAKAAKGLKVPSRGNLATQVAETTSGVLSGIADEAERQRQIKVEQALQDLETRKVANMEQSTRIQEAAAEDNVRRTDVMIDQQTLAEGVAADTEDRLEADEIRAAGERASSVDALLQVYEGQTGLKPPVGASPEEIMQLIEQDSARKQELERTRRERMRTGQENVRAFQISIQNQRQHLDSLREDLRRRQEAAADLLSPQNEQMRAMIESGQISEADANLDRIFFGEDIDTIQKLELQLQDTSQRLRDMISDEPTPRGPVSYNDMTIQERQSTDETIKDIYKMLSSGTDGNGRQLTAADQDVWNETLAGMQEAQEIPIGDLQKAADAELQQEQAVAEQAEQLRQQGVDQVLSELNSGFMQKVEAFTQQLNEMGALMANQAPAPPPDPREIFTAMSQSNNPAEIMEMAKQLLAVGLTRAQVLRGVQNPRLKDFLDVQLPNRLPVAPNPGSANAGGGS